MQKYGVTINMHRNGLIELHDTVTEDAQGNYDTYSSLIFRYDSVRERDNAAAALLKVIGKIGYPITEEKAKDYLLNPTE